MEFEIKNWKGKEYNGKGELEFEGKYLNGMENYIRIIK